MDIAGENQTWARLGRHCRRWLNLRDDASVGTDPEEEQVDKTRVRLLLNHDWGDTVVDIDSTLALNDVFSFGRAHPWVSTP